MKTFLSLLFGLFVLLQLRDGNSEQLSSDLQHKKRYVSNMMELYDSIRSSKLSGSYLTLMEKEITPVHEAALMGMIMEALNSKRNPQDQFFASKPVEMNVNLSCGVFDTLISVDSLSRGQEVYKVKGFTDMDRLKANITYVQGSVLHQKILPHQRNVVMLDQFNNGSKGIPELLELTKKAQCKKNSDDECERGSVIMNSWLNDTLTFERWLQENLTYDKLQTFGSHNSFNNKADGYGSGDFLLGELLELVSGGDWEFVWAQEWFTMTDQLNMGVRRLMMDPVYFWGKMRLCHCGTTFKWFDKVLQFLEKAIGKKFDFDSGDLGCLPDDRTLESGIQEIANWVKYHDRDLVTIMINDEAHDFDWDHLNLIRSPVKELFGDYLFTPADKKKYFPDSWPTPHQLFSLGKRVIVTGTSRCANDDIFVDMMVPQWDKDTVKYFIPYPECGGFKAGDWYIVGGESQVVGPIYNGPEEEGLVIPENLPYLLQCPVRVASMDLVSPGLLSSAVWSWAEGYSVSNITATNCTAMDRSRQGRWVTVSCDSQFYFACSYVTNSSIVVLSNTTSTWKQALTQCPSGYEFFRPSTGYQNRQLYHLLLSLSQSYSHLWLNLGHLF